MSDRILVVGGNAAGMTAASRAKRLDPSLSVTILEGGPRIAYSICGLPFALAGRVRFEDLVLFTPETLRNERGIEARVNREAIEIQPSQKRVIAVNRANGERETHPYDRLLLATGYRPLSPGIEGTDLEGVFTASRLEDGEAILSWMAASSARRAVILGGGYVGLELAEALVERGLEVTVVERSPSLLPSLDPDMARLVEEELERKGARVLTGRVVKRIAGSSSGRVEAVELATGSLRLPADLVFVDVGVAPRVELADRAGLRLGPSGAIAVSERLETSAPSIYAAGNCAECTHLVTGRPMTIPLGTVAAKQGRIAGENLAGRRSRFAGALGTSVVRVLGVTAAATGLSSIAAEHEGFHPVAAAIEGPFQASYFGAGAPAKVKAIAERESGRLLGAQIVGSAEGALRIDVLAAAITAGMTVRDASQLDLAYAPPSGALWSPILVAMNALSRELRKT
jgi:NADPH-dependent 2,4-dienoyl-CoA reductase/sulfur reductase-like enzyme